jgi:hypothetical protein
MSDPTFDELDVVALTQDIPSLHLTRGQVGTIVHIYEPDTFEVEFVDAEGRTYGMATLNSSHLLRLRYEPVAA